MKKILKYILLSIIPIFLLTACSQKEYVSKEDINRIYKPVDRTTGIKNSKAMHRATLRPYNVFGKWYYPRIEEVGKEFIGIASWYGPKFHAKKTSNGEIYNMYAMTAAHKTLPMNTMVRVVNLENGKSIIVRINDRGPFVGTRIIDLSNKAAHEIDMVKKGTVNVKVTVLGYNGKLDNDDAPRAQLPKQRHFEVNSNNLKDEGNYSIQLGAFSRLAGARSVQGKHESITNEHDVIIKKVFSNERYLYKVFIMGFKSYNQALNFKDSNGLNNAIIVEE